MIDHPNVITYINESFHYYSSEGEHQESGIIHAYKVEAPKPSVCEHVKVFWSGHASS